MYKLHIGVKMKRTQIFLTEQQVENIKQEAEKSGIRFSEMLRRIVDFYFKKQNETLD